MIILALDLTQMQLNAYSYITIIIIITYTGCNDDWCVAVDMLVTNAAELMSSIKELLEAAEIDQIKMQNLQSDDCGKYR